MLDTKRTKRFLRRKFMHSKRDIEDIGENTEEQIDKHVFRRLNHLSKVRRPLGAWLFLAVLMIFVGFLQLNILRDKYQPVQFVEGGVFSEGIVGQYTNSNPIYATSSVDTSVSKLIYSGLFSYDENSKLVPDLAETIEVSNNDKTYTVTLKKDLKWQDGQPITAKDVAYTYNTIKDADANSFLAPGWAGIKVSAKDDYNVEFILPNVLGAFAQSLVTGILPEHLLKDVPADELRSNDFNTINAVGSGPFKLEKVEVNKESAYNKTEIIGLVPNEKYYRGQPGLSQYIIKTYDNQENLKKAFGDKKITAASDVSSIFNDEKSDSSNTLLPVNLTAQTMVFFKTSKGILKDKQVREALVLGIEKRKILASTGMHLLPSNEPLLNIHFAYKPKYAQETGKLNKAKEILEKANWKVQPDGIRAKEGQKLSFNLNVAMNEEHKVVSENLKEQWRELGVELNIISEDEEERQGTIASHNYDALLNSISVGADPDVYAYWHSSQFDPRLKTRLNFSEYKSKIADEALEGARSRNDPAIRSIKYEPFLDAWSKDNPALLLYRPQYIFLVRTSLDGFVAKNIVSPAEKYVNVENWKIRRDQRSI